MRLTELHPHFVRYETKVEPREFVSGDEANAAKGLTNAWPK